MNTWTLAAETRTGWDVWAQPVATISAAIIALLAAAIAWATGVKLRNANRKEFEDKARLDAITKQIGDTQTRYAKFLGIARPLSQKIESILNGEHSESTDHWKAANKEVSDDLNNLTQINSNINLESYLENEDVAHATYRVTGTLRQLHTHPRDPETKKRYNTLGVDLQDTESEMHRHLNRLRDDRQAIISTAKAPKAE